IDLSFNNNGSAEFVGDNFSLFWCIRYASWLDRNAIACQNIFGLIFMNLHSKCSLCCLATCSQPFVGPDVRLCACKDASTDADECQGVMLGPYFSVLQRL